MDTSNISFTALYTGQVWYEHGLSKKFFTSFKSNALYRLLQPAEMLANKFVGVSLRDMLLQRHTIIDHRIRHLIENESVTQILEIASGLSPRGYRLTKEYPELHYIEADLPAMAATKKALLRQKNALTDRHKVITCNIFESGSPSGLDYVLQECLDTSKPTIIITEGLVNYFDLETISSVWTKLHSLAICFPKAWYLTDLVPRLKQAPSYKYIRIGERLLAGVARADVNLHYTNNDEIADGFRGCGFAKTTVHSPEDYYDSLPIPKSKAGSMVRVIESRV